VTARYLLTLSDANAAVLEAMLGGRIEIVPSRGLLSEVTGERAVVAGLDGITDGEYEHIAARLRTSGPLYHAGGPGGPAPARETQTDRALAAVRAYPSRSARRLGDVILTGDGQPVTEGRARMLLRELERRGQVVKRKGPGTGAWLWDAVPLDSSQATELDLPHDKRENPRPAQLAGPAVPVGRPVHPGAVRHRRRRHAGAPRLRERSAAVYPGGRAGRRLDVRAAAAPAGEELTMGMQIKHMTVEALGLADHGVRVQVSSDDTLLAADLSRQSAVNHAVNVLAMAGIASVTIKPDGSYQAVERSN